MEEWQVVAILNMSAGNESVGEMWQETKVFDSKTSLFEVMCWAEYTQRKIKPIQPELFRGNLKLTIAQ